MQTIFDSILDAHEQLRGLMPVMSSSRYEPEERKKAFKEFSLMLEAHAGAEERFLYSPVLMHDEGLEKSRHASSEHEEASELIKKIIKLDPKGKAFLDKTKELTKAVRHHMEEEEGEYFKISKKVLSPRDVKTLNEQYLSDYEKLRKKLAKKK